MNALFEDRKLTISYSRKEISVFYEFLDVLPKKFESGMAWINDDLIYTEFHTDLTINQMKDDYDTALRKINLR